MARLVADLAAHLTTQLVTALRDRPMRFGYVLIALVLTVVLFSMAEFLPAPYDMTH